MTRHYRVILLPALLVLLFLGLRLTEAHIPSPLRSFSPLGAEVEAADIPAILPESDRSRYRAIFQAQKKTDWKQADKLIRGLSNRLLMGHVLADRYLSGHYQATTAQLAEWLERYGDHPQAYNIYTLALAKSPSLKHTIPVIRRQSTLAGYGSDSAPTRFTTAAQDNSWRKGLTAWRAGKHTQAAGLFSALADKAPAGSPQASAAAYWAYRALAAIDNGTDARKYLGLAAKNERGFYGILARKQLNLPLLSDSSSPGLSERDMLVMMHDSSVRRSIALASAGLVELAERELRTLFPQADAEEKEKLLALAQKLNLASVQMVMARNLSRDDRRLDSALYPIPHWQPQDGFKIEPALLYALARKESGFHAAAVSTAGAMGLMQLMPQTASMMQKQMDQPKGNASDPVLNITLGQNYVQHLLENSLVDGNLIYMLVAYNAGAGRLQQWKTELGQDDPLLFVENIPYGETRNYVMQVMASYWIYSELAGTPSNSVAMLAKGRWPSYDTRIGGLAARMQLIADKAG